MAGRDGPWPEHLREGEQAPTEDDLHLVRDQAHQLRRQEVHHQACGQERAQLRVLQPEGQDEQTGKSSTIPAHFPPLYTVLIVSPDTGPVHGKPRPVHATEKARLHGAAADEGGGEGGEAAAAGAAEPAGQGEAVEGGGRTGQGQHGAEAAAVPGGDTARQRSPGKCGECEAASHELSSVGFSLEAVGGERGPAGGEEQGGGGGGQAAEPEGLGGGAGD